METLATQPKNITASALISSTPGMLVGMYVNSTNAGTIKIYNGKAAAGVKATVVLTIDTAPIADGDQINIGGQVYTWVDALTAETTANEVLIGVSDATALDNLLSAVNKSAGGGTTYGSETVANAYVTATTNTDTEQTFEAKAVGESYNLVAVSSSNAGVTFASDTLLGGINAPTVMNNTITPAVGYHNLGNGNFAEALYVTIAGTALDVTLYYK